MTHEQLVMIFKIAAATQDLKVVVRECGGGPQAGSEEIALQKKKA